MQTLKFHRLNLKTRSRDVVRGQCEITMMINKIGRGQDGARGYQVGGSVRANRDGNATWGAEWVPRVTLAREAPNGKEMEEQWNSLGLGGGRHRGRNHNRIHIHTHTGMFPFSIHIHIHIHKFTRRNSGADATSKNRGEGLIRTGKFKGCGDWRWNGWRTCCARGEVKCD